MSRLPLCAVAALLLLSLPRAAAAAEPTKQQCVAANDQGQDLVQTGHLLAAREAFRACVAPSCPSVVRDDCTERLRDVTSSIPTVLFDVVDPSGTAIAAVKVTVDGQPLADRLDGVALEVDPGFHVFVLRTPSGDPLERSLNVQRGEKGRHERVVLGTNTRPSPAPRRTLSLDGPAPLPSSRSGAGDAQRWVGLGLGGAGAFGLGLGSVFALVANSTYQNAIHNECFGGNASRCSPSGIDDGRTAHAQALASTTSFVAAAALLGAGAAVYLTAPQRGVSLRPAMDAGSLGLEAVGAWQ